MKTRVYHGLRYTKAYIVWSSMKTRCTNSRSKSYPNYGGRGIKVCSRWDRLDLFVEDMGQPPPGLTLDRIDNDGDYSPSNCRWATIEEQISNKRKQIYAPKIKDISGVRFGKLVVISYSHKDKNRKWNWNCLCDCGNRSVVVGSSLRSGTTSSCGCNLIAHYRRNSREVLT